MHLLESNADCDLNLAHIPMELRHLAIHAFSSNEPEELLRQVKTTKQLRFVHKNISVFQARGIFERALCFAYVRQKGGTHGWTIKELDSLFSQANPDKLRSCGDNLPGNGPFSIFRGVCGTGKRQRVRGYSWSGSIDVACYFACWSSDVSKAGNPGIYRANVVESEVHFFWDKRSEQEFVVRPRSPERVEMSVAEMKKRFRAHLEFLRLKRSNKG